MYIFSAFTDKLIDFTHFDELMIGYFDKDGRKCGFSEADFFELRAAKLTETGSVPAWTSLFQSKSYRECSEVMLQLIAQLKNNSPVVEINYKDADMADYSPVVREYDIF